MANEKFSLAKMVFLFNFQKGIEIASKLLYNHSDKYGKIIEFCVKIHNKGGISMNLFAYISLDELSKILQRNVGEIGSKLGDDENKVSSHELKEDKRYLDMFEDLEVIKIMQRYYGSRPEFSEGGVVVKVNVPSRLALPKKGTSIFRFSEDGEQDFAEVDTFSVRTEKLRIDNFVDVVFDPNCESYVEDIRCDFDFKSREKA